MLNSSALNSLPLNGRRRAAPGEPAYVVRGTGYQWRLRVIVGGLDVTSQLTGGVEVDREEGGAGVAGFDLHIGAGPVVPTEWTGKPVTIDYLSRTLGVVTEARRYTGFLSQPVWNPIIRVLSCECSDNLQQRVEALTVEQVDALVGGVWSEDVFEPVSGRSHWDYAQERMSTQPASLDCSPTGELRIASWYASAPAFVFGAGATAYQSVDADLAEHSRITNRIEIEFSYRYNRLWQRNQSYAWKAPSTGTSTGLSGFCNWLQDSHELPTKEMVEEAASSNGQTAIGQDYYSLPPSMDEPCGIQGSHWTNIYDNLLLGVNWIGARRWVQTVTEKHLLVLATAAGEAEAGRIVQREAYVLDIEDAAAEEWVDEPILGGDSGFTDLPSEDRRTAAMNVALQAARAQIVSAHRGNILSWQVPTSMAMGVDLVHTLTLDDQGVTGTGKCCRIVDSFNMSSGEAITTLSIAVLRGGGVSDALVLPERLGAADSSSYDGGGAPLPTQLGGRWTSGDYDDALPGFSGNYAVKNDETLPDFERRLDAEADEIPAEDRDERLLTAETLYRVGIPDSPLEL